MRNLLLFLVLVLFGLTSPAQDYHPLIEDDKVWLEAYYFMIGSNECDFSEVYQLRFGGDTLIAGNTYRKILKRSFDAVDGWPYCPPFEAQDVETMVPDVFMREDTTEQRVYIWHIDEDEYPEGLELLMFDFSLEVGDTMVSDPYVTLGSSWTVTNVSEITLLNGETRKRIEYIGPDYGAMIEGLGSENGLFRPHFMESWWNILCVKQDGSSIYPDFGSLLQCNWMTTVDEIPASAINLYPNPNNGAFTFEIKVPPTGDIMHLMIFNAMGQQVYLGPVASGITNIDASLPVGLYHWQLRSEGLPIQTGKLVVQ